MGGGPGGPAGAAGVRTPIEEDRSVRVASLAAEYEWGGAGPWSAVLGGGYAVQSREGRSDEEGAHALLGGRRTLGSAWAVRGSVARKIRFPTLRDLYGAGRSNPDLEAETTRQYELGLEHFFGGGGGGGEDGPRSHRVELVLFRIDADDFIQGLPGEPLANTEDTRRQGVELSGSHRVDRNGPGHRLDWSYTYLDAENRSPGADVPTIQNQPRHKAALAATLKLPFALEGRGDVLYVADSYALTRTRPTRRQELGDYTVLGLGLSRPIGHHLRLRAQVDNALDESYFESIGFPGPGRTWWLRLELGGLGD
jgi:iron complex outermembrane receptor protein